MSYILDALKKSEAERNRDTGPTLLSSPQHTPHRRQTVMMILIAVLALNAFVVVAWLIAPTFDDPLPAAASQAVRPPMPPATPAPRQPSVSAEPAGTPPPRVEARPVPSTPVHQPAVAPKPRVIAPPGPPTFDISTHVYADDPEFRAITVNGKRLTEGDRMTNGWTLASITETGVVMERNGERVVMDVLQDWRD